MMRRLLPILVVSFLISAFLPLTVSNAYSCTGGICYWYAGWFGTTSDQIYGIDGYINAQVQSSYSGSQSRSDWINLCDNSCAEWVQTGECQGACSNGHINESTEDVYLENNWDPCSYYSYVDKGAPDTTNEAYYLSSTNSSFGFDCSPYSREYQFVMKKGSWSNPATGYLYLPTTQGQVISETELHSGTTTPPSIGVDYYGTDNSHNPSGPNGMHVQNSLGGTWNAWDETHVPGSSYVSDSPPVLHTPDHYWSFYAD